MFDRHATRSSNFSAVLVNSLVLTVLLAVLDSVALGQYSRTTFDGYTPTGVEQGAPAGAYALSGFENINLFNGSLNVALPLLKIGGRGTAGYTMTLQIDKHWQIYRETDGPNVPIVQDQAEFRAGRSWRVGYGPGVLLGLSSADAPFLGCPIPTAAVPIYYLTRLSFVLPDGSEVLLHDKQSGGEAALVNRCVTVGPGYRNRGKVFVSDDGESVTFISDSDISDSPTDPNLSLESSALSGYLLMKDGTRYRIDAGTVSWIRDRNGNKVSFEYQQQGSLGEKLVTSITDSLNRVVNISYASPSTGYDEISFKGFGQASRSIKVWYSPLTNILRPDSTIKKFNQLFPEVYASNQFWDGDSDHNPKLVSQIDLPDEAPNQHLYRLYQFRYNSYGEVARIILPTGGGFDYNYAGFAPNGTGGSQNVYDLVVYRRLTKRTAFNTLTLTTDPTNPPLGTREKIEDYALESGFGSLGPTLVRVEQRDAVNTLTAQSKHFFYGNPAVTIDCAPVNYSWWPAGKEYKTETFSVSGGTAGAALRRSESIWDPAVTDQFGTPIFAPPPVCFASPAPNPKLAETVSSLLDTNQVTKQTFSYDQYNNQTDAWEYDFGVGAPGSLIRQTHTDFKTAGYDTVVGGINNPNPGATIHLRSLPVEQVVKDAQGVVRSKTTYKYDNESGVGSPWSGLQDCPGVPGLVDRLDQPYSAANPATNDHLRGNVTQVSRYLLASTGPVTSDQEIVTNSQYDIAGNVVKTRDAKGAEVQIGYSADYGYAYPTSTTSPIPDSTGQFGASMPLNTSTTYDPATGKVVSTTDANGQTTTFEYNDPLDRLTRIARPLGETIYEYGLGNSDSNRYFVTKTRQSSSGNSVWLRDYAFYDGLGRTWRTAHLEEPAAVKWSISDTKFDALGRVSQTSNPYCAVTSGLDEGNLPHALNLNVCSSEIGGVQWTTTAYDALSRVTSVTTPDGAHVDSAYLGNKVTVADQVGKQRSSLTDALGRLVQVNEAPNVSGFNYQTNYSYDVLNNLTLVRQGGFPLGEGGGQTVQFRRFYYDSLSRLVYANNPEQNATIPFNPPGEAGTQWTMKYEYDVNGNLTSRTDARGVTANYTYDALNRNKQVSYTDGTPTVKRCYDVVNPSACTESGQSLGTTFPRGLGRLRATKSLNMHPVTTWAASSRTVINGYDELGRATGQRQGFWHSTSASAGSWKEYQELRTYDLASHPLVQTYPSGRYVTNVYNAGGRLSESRGTLGPVFSELYYASGISYNAAGQMTAEQFGDGSALYHTARYNNRLQMVETRLGTAANWVPNDQTANSATWNRGRLVFYYSDTARTNNQPWEPASDNNGNVSAQEHYVPITLNPTTGAVTSSVITQRDDYYYDAVNRLASVEGWQWQSNPGWQQLYQQSFLYDKFGNRRINTATNATWGAQINNASYDISQTNNRVLGTTYDSAGNVIREINGSRGSVRVYDAENRMVSTPGTGGTVSYYVYDGDGRRVRRLTGGNEYWQVYGLDGALLAEYPANGAPGLPWTEYGYRNGQLLIVAGCDVLRWLVPDHLGTARMEVGPSGILSELKRHDYLPFGEELYIGMGGANGVTPVRSAGMGYTGSLTGDCVRQRFASYERDNETGLDFAQARYFSNVQGRFTSPDEFTGGPTELFAVVAAHNPTFYADIFDPQSLNKYSYCLNNPLRFIDPDGHQSTVSDRIAISIIVPTPRGLDSAKGIAKSVANVFIGANNIGNEFSKALGFGDSYIEPYQPSNSTQAAVMDTTDKLLVLGSLLTGKGPANVMITEGEQTAVATAQATNKGFLIRLGSGPETTKTLATQAAAAEAAGLPHGVSTNLVKRVSGSDKAHRSATVQEVQQEFGVQQTGRNKKHHTVVLPKPVTQETVDKFNSIFKPGSQ